MQNSNPPEKPTFSEVNLKEFIRKIFDHKLLIIASVLCCLAIAFVYIKIATPVYLANTSILIDQSGQSRMLGESKYVEGGVGLIETEKNIYNEKGILKSYSLIEKTLKELNFNISYHSGTWYKQKENYGYFPFEVELIVDGAQTYGIPFFVEILSDETFQLKIEAEKFTVTNPVNGTSHEVETTLNFAKTYTFGDTIAHDYFNLIIKKPAYKVVSDDFAEKELFFQIHSYENLANTYIDKLEVDQIDIQSSILTLQLKGAVLDKEKDFLGKLTKNYIQTKLNERDVIASNKEDFIQDQLSSISDSLANAERNLETFKRGANAVNLSKSASNSLDRLQILESGKGQIALNIKYYYSLLDYMKESDGIQKIIAPSVVGINDPLLNENLLELKRLNSERTRLAFIKGEKSYDLKLLDEQITNTTNSLKENLKNLIQASDLALKDKNQQIAKLERTINSLPGSEKRLLNFERKSTLYENLFNYLSQELAKTGIARAEDITDTRIIDEPRMVGDGPYAPQKMLIMALALILGLMLPLIWIILADTFNDKIQNKETLENYSNIPVAASIVHNDAKVKFLHAGNSKWQVEESFKDLSASLQFLLPDSQNNIIGVTSMIPGEGKTFCATNLCVSFAKAGKKILLIDLDFHNNNPINGSVSPEGQRLSAYLSGEAEFFNDAIFPYEGLPGFHYLASDVSPKNAHELLSSPRLATLIKALRFEYDYIVIDSPAVGVVSDYLLVSRYIDIHLFVLRAKYSKVAFVSEIEKLIRKGKMKTAFLILNDIGNKFFKYGISYSKLGLKKGRFGSGLFRSKKKMA